MTFAIHTFGCKVNIYESEYVTNLLLENNYQMLDFNGDKEANIYIINTCTVTNEADKKDRKLIHTTRNSHKNAILIVMGCYSQLNPQTIDADIVIGNKYKSEIINLINEFKNTHQKIVKVDNIEVNTMSELRTYIYSKVPGESVTLTLNRNGKEYIVEIKLGKR